MLRVEDIAAHPESVAVIAAGHVQTRLGRPISNPRQVVELKMTGNWTWPETVSSFATGLVDAVEAWEAVEQKFAVNRIIFYR